MRKVLEKKIKKSAIVFDWADQKEGFIDFCLSIQPELEIHIFEKNEKNIEKLILEYIKNEDIYINTCEIPLAKYINEYFFGKINILRIQARKEHFHMIKNMGPAYFKNIESIVIESSDKKGEEDILKSMQELLEKNYKKIIKEEGFMRIY